MLLGQLISDSWKTSISKTSSLRHACYISCGRFISLTACQAIWTFLFYNASTVITVKHIPDNSMRKYTCISFILHYCISSENCSLSLCHGESKAQKTAFAMARSRILCEDGYFSRTLMSARQAWLFVDFLVIAHDLSCYWWPHLAGLEPVESGSGRLPPCRCECGLPDVT